MTFIKKTIKQVFGVYAGLPASVYVIFIARTINGIGIFVYPFLALYLTQLLHFSEAKAGMFLFVASLVYIPGVLIGGKLADHFGRKKIVIIAQVLVSTAMAICGFLKTSLLVPLLILVYMLFDGFADPAHSAMNTDMTTAENRQASFALGYLGHNVGYAIGSVIAGFLFYRAPQWLFWGNAIMSLLAVLLIFIFIPETKPTKEQIEKTRQTNSTEKLHEGNLLSALASRPSIIILALFISLIGFSYGQTLFSLPLLTTEKFGKKGAELFGQLMSLNGIVVVLFNAPVIAIFRKNKALKNIFISTLLFAAGFTCYAFSQSILSFYILTFIWTLAEVIEATNTHYYIANNTPINYRGRFSAVLPIVQGSGRAAAPLIGGMIISSMGLQSLWIISGFVCIVAGIGVFALYKATEK